MQRQSDGATSSTETEELRRWSRRQIALGAGLWALGLGLLALLSVFAHQHPTFTGDVGLTEWVQGLDTLHAPWLVHFVNFASDANWPTPAGTISISVVVLLLLLRRVRASLCALLSGFGADGLNVTLNGVVSRPRPNDVHIHAVAHLGLHSFPSGHVTHVVAFYGFLLYLSFVEDRAHPNWRIVLRAVQVICVYFLIFIGPSRVLEGEHWPSDVFASYLLGALVLVAAIALYHWLGVIWERRHEQKPQPATQRTA